MAVGDVRVLLASHGDVAVALVADEAAADAQAVFTGHAADMVGVLVTDPDEADLLVFLASNESDSGYSTSATRVTTSDDTRVTTDGDTRVTT